MNSNKIAMQAKNETQKSNSSIQLGSQSEIMQSEMTQPSTSDEPEIVQMIEDCRQLLKEENYEDSKK